MLWCKFTNIQTQWPTFLFLSFLRYVELVGLLGHMPLMDYVRCRVPPLHPPASSARSVRSRLTFSGRGQVDHLAILQANISSKLRSSRHPPRTTCFPPGPAAVVHCMYFGRNGIVSPQPSLRHLVSATVPR